MARNAADRLCNTLARAQGKRGALATRVCVLLGRGPSEEVHASAPPVCCERAGLISVANGGEGTLRVRPDRILRREHIREPDGEGRRRRLLGLGETSVKLGFNGGDQGGDMRARDFGTRHTERGDVESLTRQASKPFHRGEEIGVCKGALGGLCAVCHP